jgi:hypothetical protein
MVFPRENNPNDIRNMLCLQAGICYLLITSPLCGIPAKAWTMQDQQVFFNASSRLNSMAFKACPVRLN